MRRRGSGLDLRERARRGIGLALREIVDVELLEDAVPRAVTRDEPRRGIDAVLDDAGWPRQQMVGPAGQRRTHVLDPHRNGRDAALLVGTERANLVETDPG